MGDNTSPPPNDTSGNLNMTAVQKLRAMLADPDKFITCPGVYDGFTARIALQEGVDCLYMVSFFPNPIREEKKSITSKICILLILHTLLSNLPNP